MADRLRLRAALSPVPLDGPAADVARWPLTRVTRGDRDALAQLMLDAYRGTVDDEGEDLAGAQAEVARFFDGAYGPPLVDACVAIPGDAGLEAAALVSSFEGGPFFSFLMTAPGCKRQGRGTWLTRRVMEILGRAGNAELSLVVTATNEPALAIYRALGFREIV